MRRALVAGALAVLLVSCHKKSTASFSLLEEDFVFSMLAFSPVSASAQGYHSDPQRDFDTALDDMSMAALDGRRSYLSAFHLRLAEVDKQTLSPEDRADYDTIQDLIANELFDLDIAQSWRHNPTLYVESVGAALFNPYVLNYAPPAERAKHIIARLQKVPIFFDQADRNLFAAPPMWIQVARQENQGNIELVDKTLRPFIPEGQRADYDRAAMSALVALRSFDSFLADTLPNKVRGGKVPDWRLGQDNYKTKFRFALGTDQSPDEVLAGAESDLKRVRAEMNELSKRILQARGKTPAGDPAADIAAALALVAEKKSTVSTYFSDARSDLAEAKSFAEQKHLLTLPARGNLQVIETPAFLRGIYAVGGFNPAPALQPELGAFYWITPIPSAWEKSRIESKLREYNFYNLKLLTIHEAMPGHYVQFEFANDVQPKTRRVLRGVWGNTPYVEGWAQYITQVMLDRGYLDGAPELRLTFLKQELRVIANAILDIRLQTNRMTDRQAMDLMEKDTFQEHEEATAKLQRAQLSSAQLPAYFVGWRDWRRVRAQYEKAKGTGFQEAAFHDAALKEGAVPLPVLYRLLTGKELAR